MNPAVKAFMISESFLWPAWNFMAPIMAIFAANSIEHGTIETAGFAYSIHLIIRVIFELISGKMLAGSHTRRKITVIISGIAILSLAYLFLAYIHTIMQLFIAFGIAGMGFGIIAPAKNSLFASHLDKDKETLEWGIADATVFITIALAASLGGLIAGKYGFHVFFTLSAWVNTLAAFPYIVS